MFNINTSNNSSLSLRFHKRPVRFTTLMPVMNKDGEIEARPMTGMGILKDPTCNNCKVKAQRTPRALRRLKAGGLSNALAILNTYGSIMGSKAFARRGMEEEAFECLNEIEVDYRAIQIRRRRERDQAQKWKRSGKLIEE